jgi:hypothetical protein
VHPQRRDNQPFRRATRQRNPFIAKTDPTAADWNTERPQSFFAHQCRLALAVWQDRGMNNETTLARGPNPELSIRSAYSRVQTRRANLTGIHLCGADSAKHLGKPAQSTKYLMMTRPQDTPARAAKRNPSPCFRPDRPETQAKDKGRFNL